MAPSTTDKSQDFTDRPLADYFWIAGLDGQDVLDAYTTQDERHDSVQALEKLNNRAVDQTIEEDAAGEDHANSFRKPPSVSNGHSRQNSYQKLAKLSSEARSSIQSLDKLTTLSSTRSSTTIRRVISSGGQSPSPSSPGHLNGLPNGDVRASNILSEADFDDVMKKFTKDRESFYLDLNFNSDENTPKSNRTAPKPKPQIRTQRILSEELEPNHIPNRALGSVRRHISFKDMNSAKRQLSVSRRLSTRSARRVSSYNSVMPVPQPFQPSQDQHPLKHSFEPVLLDRYPRPTMQAEIQRRIPFPDYVPMFAFPTDVHIQSSDTRPATKWHEFYLTGADNSRTPAVCVIIWIPLERKIADYLEKKCDEWRNIHMTGAERELAASLGERLAAERAKLSRLLTVLPSAESGTAARDDIEERIGVVEEKIALMSEMLRPLRHGAASRIDGLTDGDTGLWIPRAYGILGKDQAMIPFWKEWLKAVVVPMLDGAVSRIPPSSPRVGMWQPLERYVYTICTQSLLPMTSKVQVELYVRELRLYAKREASNELPGSRTVDLYALFRSLTIPNIIALVEYLLAESRVILVSQHVSMLKLASNALLALIWPFEWAGVYIPVLPTRLMEVLEAPIPYVCGIVRTTDNLPLPQDDDFVMVDLDRNELHATVHPPVLPRQHRRKLMSLLYLAAPHHQTRGVAVGPPAYVQEAFPHNMFVSENPAVFAPIATSTDLARLTSISSTQFGFHAVANTFKRAPILNAFLQSQATGMSGMERPQTASTARRPSQTGSEAYSPITSAFPPLPLTPQSRNDSGFALQTSLKEKRSGHFDSRTKQSISISHVRRKASLPFVRHNATLSQISGAIPLTNGPSYAPSISAKSTLAASTIMMGTPYQPARNTETTTWVEGHCLQWSTTLLGTICSVCNEKCDDGLYKCSDCSLNVHGRCSAEICLPCTAAFQHNQVRVAFARFFTSLLYNYRRFFVPADLIQRKSGMLHKFNADAWIRSLSPDHAEYMNVLRQTQAFDTFVYERETSAPNDLDSIKLFDALVAAKKGRTKGVRSSIAVSLSGRNPFAGKALNGVESAAYLADESSHTWRIVKTPHSSNKADLGPAGKNRDYRKIVSRTPAKLEDDLFAPHSVPKVNEAISNVGNNKRSLRQRLNGLSMHAP